MNKINLIIIITSLFLQTNIFSQIKKADNFFVVKETEGDLNNDGRKDRVTVSMDTVNKTVPLKLQIFITKPNGKLNLVVSTTKIMEAQYPVEKKGQYSGNQVPDFFIEKGNLTMWNEIKGGNIYSIFKYQNMNFELININKLTKNTTKGYTDENSIFTEIKFNLITGLRIETDEIFGSGKKIKTRKKIILIRPLPKIQDIDFLKMNNY